MSFVNSPNDKTAKRPGKTVLLRNIRTTTIITILFCAYGIRNFVRNIGKCVSRRISTIFFFYHSERLSIRLRVQKRKFGRKTRDRIVRAAHERTTTTHEHGFGTFIISPVTLLSTRQRSSENDRQRRWGRWFALRSSALIIWVQWQQRLFPSSRQPFGERARRCNGDADEE